MPHGFRLEVYTLVDPSQASEVVDSVLELVEDHSPKPMVDMKPVEKHPTAVDKFDKHQTEYESRGKSKDRVKQVHDHNSGYPQLRDELDRRRSFTRIQSDNRAHNTKTTNRSRQIRNPRRKERKTRRARRSRVTKYRRQDRTKLRRAMRYYTPRPYVCDYCGCRYVSRELLPRCASHPVSRVSTSSVKRFKTLHKRDSMTNMSHKDPEPSEASVSSYHSFYSSDHEPME